MTPENAKITRKEYEEEMRKLQIELCKLQEWVKHAGLRIIVIFEGRDAAGKECLRAGGEFVPTVNVTSPRLDALLRCQDLDDRQPMPPNLEGFYH